VQSLCLWTHFLSATSIHMSQAQLPEDEERLAGALEKATSNDNCRPYGHPAHGFQLTAFNDAKLWSLYLVIGNELRYKNPIHHKAFEHIACFVHPLHVYAIAFKFVPTQLCEGSTTAGPALTCKVECEPGAVSSVVQVLSCFTNFLVISSSLSHPHHFHRLLLLICDIHTRQPAMFVPALEKCNNSDGSL
jgi:hypothetical protein